MYRWSGGSPRRLNQLASRVLLFGAVEGIETFGAEEVTTVIADLNDDTPESMLRPRAEAAPRAREEPLELREVAPMPIGSPTPPPPADPRPIGAAPAADDAALTRRIGELEAHLKEQDEALRRVLMLLVDWVESGGRQPPSRSFGAAPRLGRLRRRAWWSTPFRWTWRTGSRSAPSRR